MDIKIKAVKTITGHTEWINSLLHLKDGRIASSSDDKTIRIYEPSKDYHCDQVIERHNDNITSICQMMVLLYHAHWMNHAQTLYY